MADDRSQGGSSFGRIGRFVQREGERIAVAVIGGVVVVTGVVLMPLPGPGMLIVLAGLAILATQFEWAQDILDRARARAKEALDRIRGRDEDDGGRIEDDGHVDDDGQDPTRPESAQHADNEPLDGRSDAA
ncbi:MAG: PGPGW domain-containing protein [Actinobacteria bacterium]|nr:PGPGW domain-containing protein [Actinomycetota bacterium]